MTPPAPEGGRTGPFTVDRCNDGEDVGLFATQREEERPITVLYAEDFIEPTDADDDELTGAFARATAKMQTLADALNEVYRRHA